MTHKHLMIGLPVVAAAISVPATAQAAPATDVAASMASYAQNTAGADADTRAAEKQARYLARKEAGEAPDCDDFANCAPSEACKECDDGPADVSGKGADRHA
jgi:ABC-type transporter MlaC component